MSHLVNIQSKYSDYVMWFLHENRAPPWEKVSLKRFLDRGQLWNYLDGRPIVPMDNAVSCMSEKMASIARYFVIFSIRTAILNENKLTLFLLISAFASFFFYFTPSLFLSDLNWIYRKKKKKKYLKINTDRMDFNNELTLTVF